MTQERGNIPKSDYNDFIKAAVEAILFERSPRIARKGAVDLTKEIKRRLNYSSAGDIIGEGIDIAANLYPFPVEKTARSRDQKMRNYLARAFAIMKNTGKKG